MRAATAPEVEVLEEGNQVVLGRLIPGAPGPPRGSACPNFSVSRWD